VSSSSPDRREEIPMRETDQLAHELERAWEPWRVVLGDDAEIAGKALQQRSRALWAALEADRAPEVAQAVLEALWGAGRPPATWWQSPLGRAIGQALPHDVTLTNQEAADILGVGRGTISNLVARGAAGLAGLDQVPDTAKISLRSVLVRLGTPRAPGRPARESD
jgi:hypothetical protein